MSIEYKVVMLPTKEKTGLVRMNMTEEPKSILRDYNVNIEYGNDEYQYLYITSNEEIKIDDYYIKDNLVHRRLFGRTIIPSDSKKIITSTNLSLESLLPIPKEFIEEYISRYNAGDIIEDVMLDLNQLISDQELGINSYYPEEAIKISPKKDSWNREEVIALCIKAFNDGREDFIDDEWINKNLY